MLKLFSHLLLLCLLISLTQGSLNNSPYHKKAQKSSQKSSSKIVSSPASVTKSKTQNIQSNSVLESINKVNDTNKKSSLSKSFLTSVSKSSSSTQKATPSKISSSQVNIVSPIVKQTKNNKSTNVKTAANNDYKTNMALMISQLSFVDTPSGKKLQNQLTNDLFAIYNTLNKIGNKNINQALYKNNLKKQVDKFLSTLDKIQKIGISSTKQSSSSIILGTDNILIGDESIIDGGSNKVVGNNTLVNGKDNMISGNKSVTSGESNILIGNNSFVLGHNNTASGNNTYVFATNSQVSKNNSLVVANYTIDLNELNSKNTLLKNVLSSSKGKK